VFQSRAVGDLYGNTPPYANVASGRINLFFAIAADRSGVRQAELYVGIDLP
jgi:hypothetical protein